MFIKNIGTLTVLHESLAESIISDVVSWSVLMWQNKMFMAGTNNE